MVHLNNRVQGGGMKILLIALLSDYVKHSRHTVPHSACNRIFLMKYLEGLQIKTPFHPFSFQYTVPLKHVLMG
jgi:hypothetical protein